MASEDFKVSTSWQGATKGLLKNTAPASAKKTRPSTAHGKPARLAAVPFLTVGFLTVIGWSLARAPEFLQPTLLTRLWQALAPIAAVQPSGLPGETTTNVPVALVLLFAAILVALAYTPLREAAPVMLGIAGAITVGLAWNVLANGGELRDAAPAAVISLLCAGSAMRAAWLLRNTSAPKRPSIGWTPGFILVATLCVPLALGRLLSGATVEQCPTAASLAELLAEKPSWWTIALGATVLIAIAAAVKLVPPYGTKSSLAGPAIALVAAILVGSVYLLPQTRDAGGPAQCQAVTTATQSQTEFL